MKTQEEIEQLAEKYATSIYGFSNENYNDYLECKRHCIEFYSQCQEDMADYIFEVARQFHRLGKYSGTISDTHFTDIYEETIKSLNKQD